MKKTQVTDVITTIKRTFIAFLSIFIFVNLAVGLFTGLSWSGKAIRNAFDATADAGQLHDISITLPYSLNEADLQRLAQTEGIAAIEGGYSAYVNTENDAARMLLRVSALNEKIDICTVLEGVLPAKSGEIALEETTAAMLGLSLGDRIVFTSAGKDPGRMLHRLLQFNAETDNPDELAEAFRADAQTAFLTNEFTVTAIVRHPENMSHESAMLGTSPTTGDTVNGCGYVSEASFDREALNGYSVIYVRSEAAGAYSSYDEQYSAEVSELIERMKPALAVIASERSAAVLTKAKAVSDKAVTQLEEAYREIAEGEQKLAEGEQEYINGKRDLAYGEVSIQENRQKLAEGKALLDDAALQIADAEKLLNKKQKEYNAAAAELAVGEEELEKNRELLEDGRQSLEEGEADLRDLRDVRNALAECIVILELGDTGVYTPEEVTEMIEASGIVDKLTRLSAKHPETATEMAPKIAEIEFAMQTGNIPLLLKNAYEIRDMLDETIAESEADLERGWRRYNESMDDMNDAEAYLNKSKAQLAAAKKELDKGRSKLNSEKKLFNQRKGEYEDGLERLAAAEIELEEGREKLLQAEAELEKGRAELEESRRAYESANEDLIEYKTAVSELRSYECILLTRQEHLLIQAGTNVCNILNNVRYSMAGLFVIVGLLVCYFAILRIVSNQIKLIGTQKAIGFRKGEIAAKYLSYTGIAVLLGCLTGILTGAFVVEKIIVNACMKTFNVVSHDIAFSLPEILIIGGLEIGLLLGATYLAVRAELKKNAIELLAGAKPPEGKARFYEKLKFWQKLPLFTKTVVNNFFTEKRRVLGTFIGIAGCTALLVTAFTLNDNVMKSFELQYRDYYHYDSIVRFDSDIDGAQQQIADALRETGIEPVLVRNEWIALNQPDGTKATGYLTVFRPDDEAFRRTVEFEPVKGETAEPYKGVWMNISYLNTFGRKHRDTLDVMTVSESGIRVNVDGYYTYYVPLDQLYMTEEAYRDAFGRESVNNAFLISTAGIDTEALTAHLKGIAGFSCLFDSYHTGKVSFDIFKQISAAIVAIFVALSIAMAVMVLLNLLTMFVDEKKKELIVLMINGYSPKTVRKYISGDTVLLTVLGILGGLLLGCVMGEWTVSGFDTPATYMLKSIDWVAIAVGIAGTALLSYLMCQIALARINKFKITDINN